MIKRLFVYTILVSMTLHSACRLGIIDRLYSSRYKIAFAMGFIREIPIALCSNDYGYGDTLKITTNDPSQSVPPSVIKAEAINLFFVSRFTLPNSLKVFIYKYSHIFLHDLYELALVTAVFHPPLKELPNSFADQVCSYTLDR